jgi:hypothetical protein
MEGPMVVFVKKGNKDLWRMEHVQNGAKIK